MSKYDYNIIAIGGGSAGLVTAYIAAAAKAKVALIEKSKMGGECLNSGCIPSKALIRSAKIASLMKKNDLFGFEDVQYKVNFAQVMERVQDAIKKIEPHDSIERYTSLGVDCYTGVAHIRSNHEVEVNGKILSTKNIVIATGSRPFIPPIQGIDQINYLNSDNVWHLREQPKKLMVLGAGPIGCELAQAFCRLGSEVTLVDRLPSILPLEDSDVSQFVKDSFEKDGVQTLTGIDLVEFQKTKSGGKAIYRQNDQTKELEFDQLLIATGRKANSSGFGVEELKIALNKNGTIQVDPYLRTTITNIYACGDVAGPYQFTHTASHQAWYCAVNALASPLKKFAVDYSIIPWCTYTDPEVARVGLNEDEAKSKGIAHEVTTYELSKLDRAITDREDAGIVKVITPPTSDQILGVTICGFHAGDILAEFVLAMKYNLGLKKILGTIHCYPTLAEANKFVAGNWQRKHVPEGVMGLIQNFNRWRRN